MIKKLFGIGGRNLNEVLRVNKKRYAAGLFWQPIGVGYTPRKYAAVLSHNSNIHAGLFVEYKSMVGLGAKHKGYYSGVPSLAAEVVDVLSEYSSFLAVFFVDKKYYLLAVRNGIILADKLFSNESASISDLVII